MPERKLLIATYNKGKLKELANVLSGTRLHLLGLADLPAVNAPAETGTTFMENACIKAQAYAAACGVSALSDDSGLEVEGLGGAPGINSARYAGEGATDSERIEKLLGEMRELGIADRRARFFCAVAVVSPDGTLLVSAEGECRGRIAETPIGNGGFGYDPIFIPDGFETSFGELPPEVKERISHRARAIEKIIPFLLDFKGSVA